jgi:hypothetical protein
MHIPPWKYHGKKRTRYSERFQFVEATQHYFHLSVLSRVLAAARRTFKWISGKEDFPAAARRDRKKRSTAKNSLSGQREI